MENVSIKEVRDNIKDMNEGVEALRKDVGDVTDFLDADKKARILKSLDTVEEQGRAMRQTQERVERAEAKALEFEEKMNTRIVGDGNPEARAKAVKKAEAKALNHFMRTGEKPSSEEAKSLYSEDIRESKAFSNSDSGSGGGFAVADGQLMRILEDVQDFNDIRKFSMVIKGSDYGMKLPIQNGRTSVTEVGEGQVRSESTNAVLSESQVNYETLTSELYFSRETLADSFVDWSNYVQTAWVADFAAQESSNFISKNTGTNQGLKNTQTGRAIPNSNKVTLTAGARSSLTFDNIKQMYFQTIHSSDIKRGNWLMNMGTLGNVKAIQQNGNYPFSYGMNAQNMPQNFIWGREVGICDDLDFIADGATGSALASKTLAYFGNFMRGFVIVDRQMVEVIRDDYSRAERNQTRFVANSRVCSSVVHPKAIAVLQTAAT